MSVVSVGAGDEALLVRSILENLVAAVTLHLPGTPSNFMLVLAQAANAPAYLVVCGHGTDDGFAFGDCGPGIETTMLVNGRLPAGALDGRVILPGSVVVSTACETGSDAFGAAFTKGG